MVCFTGLALNSRCFFCSSKMAAIFCCLRSTMAASRSENENGSAWVTFFETFWKRKPMQTLTYKNNLYLINRWNKRNLINNGTLRYVWIQNSSDPATWLAYLARGKNNNLPFSQSRSIILVFKLKQKYTQFWNTSSRIRSISYNVSTWVFTFFSFSSRKLPKR